MMVDTNKLNDSSVSIKNRNKDLLDAFLQNRMGMAGFIMFSFFLLMAVFGPLFLPYDPLEFGSGSDVFAAPSLEHPLGLDDMGRDVMRALISGSRVSLLVGVLATVISMMLGTVIGIVSGYFGGKTDMLLMRFTDIFLVLPWLPLMLVIAAILGSNIWNIIFVIGLTSWSGTARVVRAQTLTVKENQYVERAKAIGAGHLHIMFKHIMPNVFPLVFANTILIAAVAIISETTLSFLGMGDTLRPSWGMMLHFAFESGASSAGAFWFLIPPGICVILVVLSFTFLGYAFDEILNPKLRRR